MKIFFFLILLLSTKILLARWQRIFRFEKKKNIKITIENLRVKKFDIMDTKIPRKENNKL